MIKKSSVEKSYLIQELIDNIPDVIYFKDKKGVLILVNKAHAIGLGLTPEEVVGHTDWDFFPSEQAKLMSQDDRIVMQTGLPIVDVIERTTQPNGSHHVVSTTKIPRKDKNGKVIGIMGVTRDITDRVRAEENRILERRKAIRELKFLKDKIETEKHKLEEILTIEESLSKIIKMESIVEFVVQKVTQILEAQKCSLMLLNPETGKLEVKFSTGIPTNRIESFYEDKNTISAYVADIGAPLYVTDIEKDKRFNRKNRETYDSKSFISMPIRLDNELIGVINVSDKSSNEGDVFSPLDLKILEKLVRHIAVSIDNANLYRELNYLTISDPITNMYNYRHYAKCLDQELDRIKRYDEELCLLMIDVDNFKQYNDTYGHVAGDKLLKEIGKVLHDNLRTLDVACRYAGDEFVVILPKTKIDQSVLVAQKILIKVHDIDDNQKISLSIGIAQCGNGIDRHQLTLNADAALYAAKRSGKNTYSIF